jgi:hypothetical protein
MQIRNIYNKMQSISSSAASHKSIVMDLPLTFNSAISHISNAAQKQVHSSARPHAATVGPEAKPNAAKLLKTTRQRGESEPTITAIVAAKELKPVVKEAPKPDRKSLSSKTLNIYLMDALE